MENDIIPAVPAVKRIIAEAIRRQGLRELLPSGAAEKRPYVEILSEMLWDAAVEGIVTFADGTQLVISESAKSWLEVVKFLSNHLDGPVGVNAQFNGVNVFKVYQGIDVDNV